MDARLLLDFVADYENAKRTLASCSLGEAVRALSSFKALRFTACKNGTKVGRKWTYTTPCGAEFDLLGNLVKWARKQASRSGEGTHGCQLDVLAAAAAAVEDFDSHVDVDGAQSKRPKKAKYYYLNSADGQRSQDDRAVDPAPMPASHAEVLVGSVALPVVYGMAGCGRVGSRVQVVKGHLQTVHAHVAKTVGAARCLEANVNAMVVCSGHGASSDENDLHRTIVALSVARLLTDYSQLSSASRQVETALSLFEGPGGKVHARIRAVCEMLSHITLVTDFTEQHLLDIAIVVAELDGIADDIKRVISSV
jgi:hypothetical protein